MKKSKFRIRRSNRLSMGLAGLAVVVAASAFGVYQYDGHKLTAAHAFSATNQMCTGTSILPFNMCLNAWNGGPAINVYGTGAKNDNFKIIGTSYDNLEFVGGGAHNGWCIGDYGNNPNDARAGLIAGCTQGHIGWGVNFKSASCYINGRYAGIQFKSVHWPGYLGPGAYYNGAAFYLNKPTPYCFKFYQQ